MKVGERTLDTYLRRIKLGKLLVALIKTALGVARMTAKDGEDGIGSFVWRYTIGRHLIQIELNYASECYITVAISFYNRRSDGALIMVKGPCHGKKGAWQVSRKRVRLVGGANNDARSVAEIFGLEHNNTAKSVGTASMLVLLENAANHLCAAAGLPVQTARKHARK